MENKILNKMLNMDDKTKVYVFAKKEVFTVFFIMVVTSFVSFLLGVSIGGEFAMRDSGVSMQMQEALKNKEARPEFKSKEEESVSTIVEKSETASSDEVEEKDKYRDDIKRKIEEEFKMEDESFNKEETSDSSSMRERPLESSTKQAEKVNHTEMEIEDNSVSINKSQWSGKYTIQLKSYNLKEDAVEFAKTVTVRGYDPIVYDIDLPGRGTWYRVTVGVFDSVSSAKEYVLKNKSFFSGGDYRFMAFE